MLAKMFSSLGSTKVLIGSKLSHDPLKGLWPLICEKNSVFVVKHSNFFSSETAAQIPTKFSLVLLKALLHRTDVGIFDSSKNMAAMAKNRTGGSDNS